LGLASVCGEVRGVHVHGLRGGNMRHGLGNIRHGLGHIRHGLGNI
jgi:hypothetical protein